MSAPSRIHQEILSFLHVRIANYINSRKGSCKVYPAPFAVKPIEYDDKTIVEPDISVICDKNKLTDRGCTGAPDWIIEIISPSNSYAGVREYWIVDPRSKKIFVYHLEKTDFEVNTYTLKESVSAKIFTDLQIDFNELDMS